MARALLSGPPTIGLESVSQLAARAEVSGPTVSRFVARLGFDNYAAFQQALRDDLSERVLSPVEVYRSHVAASDHPPLSRAADRVADAVTGTLAQLSPPDFERACHSARRRAAPRAGDAAAGPAICSRRC